MTNEVIPFPAGASKRPSKADLTFAPIPSQESIDSLTATKQRVSAAIILANVAKWCLLGFAILTMLVFLAVL